MRVRKAGTADFPRILELAKTLGLDYPGMEEDEFWLAEEDRRIVGLVGLKKHPDCLELCALGVEPAHRRRGVAKALVDAVMAGTPGDVHLATVIPGFFKSCGFEEAAVVPATFPEKRRTSWCEGCDTRLCTVLVRKVS
jgi:N-acetylglutamate synthase-like GNAT family acetyltransferase